MEPKRKDQGNPDQKDQQESPSESWERFKDAVRKIFQAGEENAGSKDLQQESEDLEEKKE